MADPTTTIIGNLTSDPELRFTNTGAPVANFTIAHTPRTFNRDTREWEDGEPLFMRCSIWRDYAENVTESLTKGDRVIATGTLKQRSWQTQDGEKRTVIEMEVDEVGPALRFATAKPQRATRTQTTGQPQAQAAAPAGGSPHDPWATSQKTGTDPWANPYATPAPGEAPF